MIRSRDPRLLLAPVGLYLFLLHHQASKTLDTHLSSHSYDSSVKVVSLFSSLKSGWLLASMIVVRSSPMLTLS